MSLFPLLFRACFQASLFLSIPFVLCLLSFKILPQRLCGYGGEGRELVGMSIFLLLAWASASPHQSRRGELERRPLGKREVEATGGPRQCGEEPPWPKAGQRINTEIDRKRRDHSKQQSASKPASLALCSLSSPLLLLCLFPGDGTLLGKRGGGNLGSSILDI